MNDGEAGDSRLICINGMRLRNYGSDNGVGYDHMRRTTCLAHAGSGHIMMTGRVLVTVNDDQSSHKKQRKQIHFESHN